jgi:pSer/pThr/pTyr-binding forkhead associated (FHA) protein
MRGSNVEHRPGAHYFATRLFDLDFARIGKIERHEGSQEIIDLPRGTGQIAYRKLVISGGVLRGALMIGERALRVRAIGRNMKRLIDAAVDVSEIKHRLLDASFDVEAWLERKRLVERPVAPQKTTLIAAAKLKRTQMVSLSSLLVNGTLALPSQTGGGTVALNSDVLAARGPQSFTMPVASRAPVSLAAAQSGMTTAIPSGPRRTRVLSIGLHAEAAPEARSSLAPLEARLEAAGRSWPITLPVTNLGQSPECQIPLQDPALSAFHAQLVRHAEGLYVRDLGSGSGTWVNGECLFGPHSLRDGDRLRIGQLEFLFRSSALPRLALDPERTSLAGPRLEVRSGGVLGLGFALGPNPVVLGSSQDCGIRLTDPSVSPHHAELRLQGNAHTLTDLGSYNGSFARGARLTPGQPLTLNEGERLRFGAVDVLFTSSARSDALARLRPSARVCVTSGSDAGKVANVGEQLLVGSDARAGLVLGSVLPQQLELRAHAGKFWVRDLSGGRAFRAGAPLGPEFSEIQHGDLLLLNGSVMLRFEEST